MAWHGAYVKIGMPEETLAQLAEMLSADPSDDAVTIQVPNFRTCAAAIEEPCEMQNVTSATTWSGRLLPSGQSPKPVDPSEVASISSFNSKETSRYHSFPMPVAMEAASRRLAPAA